MSKLVKSLQEAIKLSGLKDGMTVSYEDLSDEDEPVQMLFCFDKIGCKINRNSLIHQGNCCKNITK